ncbi:MAG: HNH endonuclease [Verrucomicrobia bacterium]|nr:HNH endonuclease [Verrucomicrobiota bacterium]
MNRLELNTVLVLNRSWQAIDTKTPQQAFCMMATDGAIGLDIEEGRMTPVRWSEWLQLPIREGDASVSTARGPVRLPTVIVLARYAKVPRKRPRFSLRAVWERDGGKCQYTGRPLRPGEGNIDHVLPRSRGGATSWTNCVLAATDVNSRKADKLPEEAGLRLLRAPAAPPERPASVGLRNQHNIPEWDLFLRRAQ